MDEILVQWGSLAGFAALISLLVNVGKEVGVVKDGQAQNWSAGLNLIGLAGLLALKVYAPHVDVEGLNSQAAMLAQVGLVVFAYVVQLLAGKATHAAVRGTGFIGKSFTK